MFLLTLLAWATILYPAFADWVNFYNEDFSVQCPSGQSIVGLTSIHSNFFEDRRWDIRCSSGVALYDDPDNECFWTYWANDYDGTVDFRCPLKDMIMTGIKSIHAPFIDDRRFRFRCCKPKESINGCYKTEWLNDWDGRMDFRVPKGRVLVGLSSIHSNFHEDRRWIAEICKINDHNGDPSVANDPRL